MSETTMDSLGCKKLSKHLHVPATYPNVPIDMPPVPISEYRPPVPKTESSTLIGISCNMATSFDSSPFLSMISISRNN